MNPNVGARWVTRTQSREYVTRQIAEETLVVPVAGGVGDLDAIYTLNEVAAHIWKMVAAPTSVDRIVEEICRVFDVPADQAADDVVTFLDALESAGLIASTSAAGTER
jgi:hypothetical protein